MMQPNGLLGPMHLRCPPSPFLSPPLAPLSSCCHNIPVGHSPALWLRRGPPVARLWAFLIHRITQGSISRIDWGSPLFIPKDFIILFRLVPSFFCDR